MHFFRQVHLSGKELKQLKIVVRGENPDSYL